jgi:hypothetical protein
MLPAKTHNMAVNRATADNTLIYASYCLLFWVAFVIIGGLTYVLLNYWPNLVPLPSNDLNGRHQIEANPRRHLVHRFLTTADPDGARTLGAD